MARSTTLRLFGILFLALASSSARADDPALEKALDRLGAAVGQDYLVLRKELLAFPGVQARLEGLLSGAEWSPATFPRLAIATAVHAHLAHPAVVKRVHALEGLDPRHYELRRRADPECGRELRQLGAAAVGPMLEVYLKTYDLYAFPEGRPDHAGKVRAALREGLMIALADTGHPAAPFVLREVAASPRELEGARKQALEGLGTINAPSAFADLSRVHDDPTSTLGLRLAALRGVAQLPSREALGWLVERIDGGAPEERRAAVVAVGLFGSAWAWESRGPEWAGQADVLRGEAAKALADRLLRLSECSDELVEALATIAHPKSPSLLRALAQDPALAGEARGLIKTALMRVELALERAR